MFKAQMAVGSWIGPPIFPSINPFVSIIENKMNREKKVDRKKKEESSSEVGDHEEYISVGE